MNHEIRKVIGEELASRREQAKRLARQTRQNAYAQNPELEEIDELINAVHIRRNYLRLHLELPKKIVEKMQLLAPELIQADASLLERALEKMTARRYQILGEMGLDDQAFQPTYTCSICGDTGFLPMEQGGSMCSCYKVLLAEKLREMANLPSGLGDFAAFNSELYPDEPNPKEYGMSRSPRAHMMWIKEHCEAFVEHFTRTETPNLLFIGRAGVGKTFLSNCIASALLEQGIPVLYMPVSALFKPFSAAAFASEEEKEMLWHMKNLILNVELLIIDDLGTEKQTETRYEEVLEILNTREMNGRKFPCKTIITTNMSPDDLFAAYGERVASRILGTFDILRFCGDDIRLKSKSVNRV